MPARSRAAAGDEEPTPQQGAENDAERSDSPDVTTDPGSVPAQPPGPPRPVLPYYIAAEALYVGGNAGSMPVRAFNAGDRVPADLVDPNGWAGQVTVPAGTEAPAPAADNAATAGQEPADDDAR